jgi:hypothetical protein
MRTELVEKGIKQKIEILASLRVLSIHRILIYFFDEPNAPSILRQVEQYIDGILLIGDSLGLELSQKPELYINRVPLDARMSGCEIAGILETQCPFDLGRIASELFSICIVEDQLAKHIENFYGKTYEFIFNISQFISIALTLKYISDFSSYIDEEVPEGEELSEDRKAELTIEIGVVHEVLNLVGDYLSNNIEFIRKLYDSSFADGCLLLGEKILSSEKDKPLSRFSEAGLLAEPLVNYLVPHYPRIEEDLKRVEILSQELLNCSAGKNDWRKYEEICIKILRFLFLPPFRKVIIQGSSADKHERRDAIIVNNQHIGFWNLIRNEFNSRNIICEFKNISTNGSKDCLNQLRTYLQKPTIGRFGILFIRKNPGKSLIQAQKNAYADSGALILILDDKKVIKLLKSRVFIGTIDDFLEDEKVKFEIEY